MRTYNELTADEKKAAFNYHLNSLIPAMSLLADSPKGSPWSTLDSEVATHTPSAQANAESSLYGDGKETEDGRQSGIFPVVSNGAPVELASTIDEETCAVCL